MIEDNVQWTYNLTLNSGETKRLAQFTVLVADILQIRAALSQAAVASSVVDLDKSGVVLVADILAARSQLSKELTQAMMLEP